MLDELAIDGTVAHYPYRTALAADIFLRLPRALTEALEAQLAKTAEVRVDNHTTYSITDDIGGSTVYVTFTDFTAMFGHSVREERW